MSALLGAQLAVLATAGQLPVVLSGLVRLTVVREPLAVVKTLILAQAAPIWAEQMSIIILQAGGCPGGGQFSSNGVIQSIRNLNSFIFLVGWALVPGAFVLGAILYFFGWNKKVKQNGLRLMVGAVGLAAVLLLWGAIASLIKGIVGGGCAPTG